MPTSSHAMDAATLIRTAVAAVAEATITPPRSYAAAPCLAVAHRLEAPRQGQRLAVYDAPALRALEALERAVLHAGARALAADLHELTSGIGVLLPLHAVRATRPGAAVRVRCLDFALSGHWSVAQCDVAAHSAGGLVEYRPVGSAPWPDTRPSRIHARVCPALAAHLSALHLTHEVRAVFASAWTAWRARVRPRTGASEHA